MPLSDAWVDFLAGWCSGAVAVLAVQPVDTVLTRWQAGLVTVTTTATSAAAVPAIPIVTPQAAAATAAAAAATTTSFGLIRNMTKSLTQSFGYTALWRGSSPMITAVPIQNALLMGGYGIGLQYTDSAENGNNDNSSNNSNNNHHRYMAIFVGGCTGGVLQSFLMSPVELVKVSQQCIPGQSLRTASLPVVWNLTHFSSRAWTGLGATLLRDGIPHGVWFVSYEMCKQQMLQQQTNNNNALWKEDSIVIPLVSGAVAATIAWAVGYPADLIKTRIQAHSSTSCTSVNLGILDTARQLIQEANGHVIIGLYRGFGLKLIRSIPASMIGFTTYEFVKKHVLESYL